MSFAAPRPLIDGIKLSKSYGSFSLFEEISLSVHSGEIVALIGENGCGKTTLMQILAGTLHPDQGQVIHLPQLTIGHLLQEIPDSNQTVKDYLVEGPLTALEKQMEECLNRAESSELNERLSTWEKLYEQYECVGGYQKVPIEKCLKGLKIPDSFLDFPIHQLSAGEKTRVALAKQLSHNPQLLLLDEPTNHLDQEMILWLQEMLLSRKGAALIISHDRKFIDQTATRLLEIRKSQLFSYGGNYSDYLHERELKIASEIKAYEEQKKERTILKKNIQAITFSKKKASAPSDRNIMAYDKRGEQHQKGTKRRLDHLKEKLADLEAAPLYHSNPKAITGLHFVDVPLACSIVIEFDHVAKSYGENLLFENFSATLRKGDRVVIQGPNGSGKTTLLRCLLGLESLDQGTIRCVSSAKIAYLDQEIEAFLSEQTPVEYFGANFGLLEQDVRAALYQAALGEQELLHRPFSCLSIGQKKRLKLLSLVLEKPNVLVLDEPTNHLDFLTIEALERALLNFQGVILAVSHDPLFTEKVATEVWAWGRRKE